MLFGPLLLKGGGTLGGGGLTQLGTVSITGLIESTADSYTSLLPTLGGNNKNINMVQLKSACRVHL